MLTALRLALRSSPLDLDRVNRWILVLTNAERARHNLSPVQHHQKLGRVAAFHCANMAKLGFFAHEDLNRRSPQDRLGLLVPEVVGAVGENIAMVPVEGAEELARTLVNGWMASPGHRRNILTKGHSHLGVSVFQSGFHVLATQLFAGLYAELLDPTLPLRSSGNRSMSLRFLFHGGCPRLEASMLLRLRRAVSGEQPRYIDGAEQLHLEWAGNTFRVSVAPRLGPGSYELWVGSSRSRKYLPSALRLQFGEEGNAW